MLWHHDRKQCLSYRVRFALQRAKAIFEDVDVLWSKGDESSLGELGGVVVISGMVFWNVAGFGLTLGSVFAGFGPGTIQTQNFAAVTGTSYLTGVAFDDTTTVDNFYTPGEGIGGVTVKATRTSDNMMFTTTTFASGGYSLPLASGTYIVQMINAGGGVENLGTHTVGTSNVRVQAMNPTFAAVPEPGAFLFTGLVACIMSAGRRWSRYRLAVESA